jgi:hypothetical protein
VGEGRVRGDNIGLLQYRELEKVIKADMPANRAKEK